MFAFSKADRFANTRTLNKISAYEIKSEFEKPSAMGSGRPFYHTTQRFNYYSTPKDKRGKLPSPADYNIKDTFGSTSFQQNETF